MISVGPNDTLLTAVKRMRAADVSQVPVVDESGRAVGILDESDVLVKVHRDPAQFNDAVNTAMTDRLETLSPDAKMTDLLAVFDRGRVAIVMDDDKFLGLITRSDLLSYLRRQMPREREAQRMRNTIVSCQAQSARISMKNNTTSPPASFTPANRPIQRPARS